MGEDGVGEETGVFSGELVEHRCDDGERSPDTRRMEKHPF